MRLARCVTVSSGTVLHGAMATYSGDWADCWLKRNGPDMLAVGLQSLQKPTGLLVRLERAVALLTPDAAAHANDRKPSEQRRLGSSWCLLPAQKERGDESSSE
jgi:hypothetical protein